MRTVRALRLYGAIWLGLAALCTLGGLLFSHFRHGMPLAHAVAWALWIGGGLVVLLVGQSGSPTRMAGESRIVVGGRFAAGSGIPQPQSPLVLIPAGVLLIGLGVLIYVAL
jgi:hypothetical protein